MSDDDHAIESVRDRAELRTMLDAIRERTFEHFKADDDFQEDMKSKMGRLLKLRTQVYLISVLFVALLTSTVGSASWVIKNAVRDALLMEGVIRIERGIK